MKKVVIFLLIVVLCCIGLVGCNTEQDEFVEAMFLRKEYHPSSYPYSSWTYYTFKVWYSEEYFNSDVHFPYIEVLLKGSTDSGLYEKEFNFSSNYYYAQKISSSYHGNYSIVPNTWIYFTCNYGEYHDDEVAVFETVTITMRTSDNFDNEENILKTYTINL